MMRRKFIAMLMAAVILLGVMPGALAEHAPGNERVIIDMAGRTMTVPAQINAVFSTNPASAIFMYTLAPEKLLGWNYALTDEEKAYILPEYHDLPSFGTGSAVNYEAVIAAGPDIALSVGSISSVMIEEADKLSQVLGIPVVCVDEQLVETAAAYRFLGELLGAEAQAEQLAAYAEGLLAEIAAMDAPQEQRVRVYYGNGEDSLETAPVGSAHFAAFEMAGAVNVADLELGDGHRMQISPEQLLAWDPDVIVVSGEAKAGIYGSEAVALFKANPLFSLLTAVQQDRVYGVPCVPFGWLDRPMAPNRLLGLRWLSAVLYPEENEHSVEEEIASFFRLFYHMELTEAQLAHLTGSAN